ncbi:MAG TPA: addiction module protein [Gemmataceae bacterium]|nr:addiction module protein [Gemmataceae bacterium]
MTRETQALFKKALKLPLESRADLVEVLLNSILEEDQNSQRELDAAWAKEARNRFEAFLQGKIKAYPMEEVMEKLRTRSNLTHPQ